MKGIMSDMKQIIDKRLAIVAVLYGGDIIRLTRAV